MNAPTHTKPAALSTVDKTRIDDTRIKTVRPLLTPALLEEWLPATEQALALVEHSRRAISRVLHYSQIAPRVAFYGKTAEGVLAAFDAAVSYVAAAPKIRFTCTDPDDQHFLDLASQHQALLVSKDKAVLKQRKRVATTYGATVGNLVLLEAALAEA